MKIYITISIAVFQGIELELRKFEVQEANEHVKMLNSYLPDYFTRRGGEET